MWGVATVVGPATGGFFAQFGLWRWAFGAVAMLTAAMAALVPMVLPAGRAVQHDTAPVLDVPVWSLLLLGAAALAVSVAEVPRNGAAAAGLLASSVLLVAVFVVVDRRTSVAVLLPSTFGSGPLKWIYLTMALLMAAAMVDTYVPLFGQWLAHLLSVLAGFLGAALAGWLDCRRDRQRIAEQQARDRPRGNRRPADHCGGPGRWARLPRSITRRPVSLRSGRSR